MENCQRCKSTRLVSVSAHASDLHTWEVQLADGSITEGEGYLPYELNLGGGDDTEVNFCLECGQLQGEFPVPLTCIEQGIEDEEDNDAF